MLSLYTPFWSLLEKSDFKQNDIDYLIKITKSKLITPIQGDYPRWLNAYKNLPEINNTINAEGKKAITCQGDNQEFEQSAMHTSYQQLIPWRKGPFDMFGVLIDAEWQSHMKWSRIENKIPDLQNRIVLDVGCGNGYYMFRMAEKQPKLLMGIDPGLLQVMQFWSIEKYRKSQACVLPLSIQELPAKIKHFDVTFSMGVLYHRKSPIHHIKELSDSLKIHGYLILETLVIDGDESQCLIPTGRYAQMRNVWFLPSVAMLKIMLSRCGFHSIECIDVSQTSVDEQRTTQWMKFHSLKQFLNEEETKTIEGYDLPKRATLIAQKK